MGAALRCAWPGPWRTLHARRVVRFIRAAFQVEPSRAATRTGSCPMTRRSGSQRGWLELRPVNSAGIMADRRLLLVIACILQARSRVGISILAVLANQSPRQPGSNSAAARQQALEQLDQHARLRARSQRVGTQSQPKSLQSSQVLL